jgi:hypothetical protein
MVDKTEQMKIEQYLKTEKKGFYGILTKSLTPIRLKQFFEAVDDWSEKKDVTTGGGAMSCGGANVINGKYVTSIKYKDNGESGKLTIRYNTKKP